MTSNRQYFKFRKSLATGCISLILFFTSTIFISINMAETYENDTINIRSNITKNQSIWFKTYFARGDDSGVGVQQTSDGGYIIAGNTESFGSTDENIWIIRTDGQGAMLWNKIIGGPGDDQCYSFQRTDDGNFIIVGKTNSFKDYEINHINYLPSDIWLIKIDESGNELWNKTYGGSELDYCQSVEQTKDGGFIFAGTTDSFGVKSKDQYGYPTSNIWLVKITSTGEEEWNHTFGGDDYELGKSVQQTSDNGYIITGIIESAITYKDDLLIIKTDKLGREQWNKTIISDKSIQTESIILSEDNSYIILSNIWSGITNTWDFSLSKLDENGTKKWEKTYGVVTNKKCESIRQTANSGYIILGWGVDGSDEDVLFIKTDSNGTEIWNKTIDLGGRDLSSNVEHTSDGGYIIVGKTKFDGTAENDIFLLKTDSNTNTALEQEENIKPKCRIKSPETHETILGIVNVTGFASDEDGAIKSVEIRIDNGPWIPVDGIDRWSYKWNTNAIENGEYTIYARAFDGIKYSYSYCIIFVENSPEIVSEDRYSYSWITIDDKINKQGQDVQITSDGGYIITGNKYIEPNGNEIFVLKIDSNGELQWKFEIGTIYDDWGLKVIQASDGGYCILGKSSTAPLGCGASVEDYSESIWLIKLDNDGEEEWNRIFRGEMSSYSEQFQQTIDEGFIIIGSTVSKKSLTEDILLLKIDAFGNEQWNRTFGGLEKNLGNYVFQTPGRDFIITGFINNDKIDGNDVWLIRTDSKGIEKWNRTYKGNSGKEVAMASDSGFIITGDIYNYKDHQYSKDILLIKTDSNGYEQWVRTFGGIFDDKGKSIQQTSDGGYVLAGSYDKFSDLNGKYIWIIKLNNNGNEEWDLIFGGKFDNSIKSIFEIQNRSFIVVGTVSKLDDGGEGLTILGINYNLTQVEIIDEGPIIENPDENIEDSETKVKYQLKPNALFIGIIALIIILFIIKFFIMSKHKRGSKK